MKRVYLYVWGWGKMCEVCVMGFMRIVTFKNYF